MSHLEDCYYFFLSSCNRKPCQYRHCDQALGSEVVCELWRVGRCKDQTCSFRHMIPNKDRSSTPCWFENQPQGCRKPHCVFQHSKPRQNVTAESLQNNLILPTTDYIPNPTVESKSNEINISIEDDDSDDPEHHTEEKQKPSDAKPSEEQEKLDKILNSSPIDVAKNDSTDETTALTGEHKQNDNRKGVFLRTNNAKLELTNCSSQNGKVDCTFVVKPLDQIRREREAADNVSGSDEVKNLSPTIVQKRALESDQDGDIKCSNTKPVKIRRNRYSVPSLTNAEASESKKSPSLSPDDSASTPLHKEQDLEKCNVTSIPELDFDLDDEFSTTQLALPLTDPSTDPSKAADVEENLEDDELMLEINQLLRN